MKGIYAIVLAAAGLIVESSEASQPKVVAWGDNSYGQCNVPANLTNAVALAADGYFSAALRVDGTLVAWGDNGAGQLNIPVAATNVVGLACGGTHMLAVRGDGRVLAWGDNTAGQCNVPAGLTNGIAVSADGNLSLGLSADGRVFAWGDASFGHLNVPSNLTNAIAIAAGYVMGAALTADRTVVTWGWGGSNIPTPPQATNIQSIATGAYQVLALRADKTVVAWGGNTYGELNVPAGCTNIVAVTAEDRYSVALRADGVVFIWGDCTGGVCSPPPGLTNVVGIRAGGYNILALVGPARPVITLQPQSQTVAAGSTFTLNVRAIGDPPLTYQWYSGADQILGETNAVLQFVSAQPWQSGSYSVVVANNAGLVSSDPAIINIFPALNVNMVPAITLNGWVGLTYQIQYVNVFGPSQAWIPLATLTLTNSPQIYFDMSAIGQPTRFYRFVQVP